MTKRILSLALTGAALTAFAVTAENIFPTKTGATWHFTGKAGPNNFSPVCKIVSVKNAGSKSVVLMKWTANGATIQDETYHVSASSVERVSSGVGGASKINPPIPVIKYPATVGKSWNWKGTVTSQGQAIPGTATIKVVSREKLKTGAGTFDAYRIDMELVMSAGGQTVKLPNTYWFAPGKGMVKQSANVMGTIVEATVTKMSGL